MIDYTDTFPQNGSPQAMALDSADVLDNLKKALSTGYSVNSGRTGAGALRVESLEASLKMLSYSGKNIRLWKTIGKTPAYSTAEEYNSVTGYGDTDFIFFNETTSGISDRPGEDYVRKLKKIKFMSVPRQVTHAATLVHNAHDDLIALTNKTGIMQLLGSVEKKLFFGDSTLAALGAEGVEFDGLKAQIDAGNVLDAQGGAIDYDLLSEATQLVMENYGNPDQIHLGVQASTDLAKAYQTYQRVGLPSPAGLAAGVEVGKIVTQSGTVDMLPNVFLKEEKPSPTAGVRGAEQPAAPTIGLTANTLATTGLFAQNSAPGADFTLEYMVKAVNATGESAPTAISSVAVTNAQALTGATVTVTITNAAAMGNFNPTHFDIYRSVANTTGTPKSAMSDFSRIASVPAASVTASATGATYVDIDASMPFTTTAFVGDSDKEILTFRQLMPLMKMDLAQTGPFYRWLLLLYGAPILFAEKKWVRIDNVKNLRG